MVAYEPETLSDPLSGDLLDSLNRPIRQLRDQAHDNARTKTGRSPVLNQTARDMPLNYTDENDPRQGNGYYVQVPRTNDGMAR